MEQSTDIILKNYRDNMENHLRALLCVAENMQAQVFATEGDSDLNRYLGMYLIPGINHWLTGNQAGNMKFLKELLERREKEKHVKDTKL